MAAKPLARVADPQALDASDGALASLEIAVPSAWLQAGAELELTAPKLLTCARCDGGGCDLCERSGAHRAPADAAERLVQLTLPVERGTALQIRLVRPFEDCEIEQLLVCVRQSEEPSANVRRIARPTLQPSATPTVSRSALIFAFLIALAAALLWALTR